MSTPWLVLWAVVAAQAPDSALRARYTAALHGLDDSLAAVAAAAVAFRVDLGTASRDLVLARARRLHLRCAAAGRVAQSLAALFATAPYSAATHGAELRARRDLFALQRVLRGCARDYDPAAGANADTLKAWGPFRLAQLETDVRRHTRGVREFRGAGGIR